MSVVLYLVLVNSIDFNVFEFDELPQMDVAEIVGGDEKLLFLKYKQISDEILTDRRVVVPRPYLALLVLTSSLQRVKEDLVPRTLDFAYFHKSRLVLQAGIFAADTGAVFLLPGYYETLFFEDLDAFNPSSYTLKLLYVWSVELWIPVCR